jgi:hypothetical protein
MALKPVNTGANPGLSKLPTDVRNKMGFMKKGGKLDIAKAIKKAWDWVVNLPHWESVGLLPAEEIVWSGVKEEKP